MEDSNSPSSVETILFLPRNSEFFKYRVNDGQEHTIRKTKIVDFLNQFINQKKVLQAQKLVSKTRPFLVLVSEEIVHELSYAEDSSTFRNQVLSSMTSSKSAQNIKNQEQTKTTEKEVLEDLINRSEKHFSSS